MIVCRLHRTLSFIIMTLCTEVTKSFTSSRREERRAVSFMLLAKGVPDPDRGVRQRPSSASSDMSSLLSKVEAVKFALRSELPENHALRLAGAAYYVSNPEDFWGDAVTDAVLQRLSNLMAQDCSQLGTSKHVLGLDVGANVGATMAQVVKCCGGQATKLHAVEPYPSNLKALRIRAEEQPLSVTICACAASDVVNPRKIQSRGTPFVSFVS